MPLNKRWKYPVPEPVVQQLAAELSLSPVMATLLANRGFKTALAARKFLEPNLADLCAPDRIPGLAKGTELIAQALQRKEKIVVYGDYDADGITATALLVSVLKGLGGNVTYYIPHRYHEGYSLNHEAIDKLAAEGTQWLITVDCGISDPQEINYAETKGIKVVVTDHHNIPEALPAAEAIVNPKLGDKTDPYYYLAGVGVAFKFAQGLYLKFGKALEDSYKLLDLVALGTVADMVPLLGENRILVAAGLQRLNASSWPGIEMLKQNAKLKENMSTRAIGYILGPRLNAAGRLENAGIAVDLLLSDSPDAAKPLAAKLNYLNSKRQEIGSKIFDDTAEQLRNDPALLDKKVLILSSAQWHPGVTGIVASQLVRKYNKPAVMITLEGATARGSIRSPDGIDIFEPLRQCQDLFLNYGGHQEAAGFELKSGLVGEFEQRYAGLLNDSITEEMLLPELKIDLKLQPAALSVELAKELKVLAPFGQGNSLPIFTADSLEIVDFRQVGDGSHLKFTLRSGQKLFDGIGFGLGEYAQILSTSSGPWEMAFSLELNEWQGKQKVQLSLCDIKLK